MKHFQCVCGGTVFFDNHRCIACGRALVFDPETLTMRAESEPGEGLPTCLQRTGHVHCNWLAPEGGACLSCRMSRVIPTLTKTVNQRRWAQLESAKRRLLYDLLSLGLPVNPQRLAFVFKEDRRTNPDVGEDHVATGYRDGVITINAAEADEIYREEMRQAMNEPYRTLIGHFRHESGHYYFEGLVQDDLRQDARELFGDERADYAAALQRHYQDGPPADWTERYISAYASVHPLEDWAECWAHYLHMRAVLEVARQARWGREDLATREAFVDLAMVLNELVRSLGLPDAYPFVITPAIGRKLDFVDRVVRPFRTRSP